VNQVISLALATLKLGYRADYFVNRRAKLSRPLKSPPNSRHKLSF
jgi:hypothetical protein